MAYNDAPSKVPFTTIQSTNAPQTFHQGGTRMDQHLQTPTTSPSGSHHEAEPHVAGSSAAASHRAETGTAAAARAAAGYTK
jgi:hypothetical protein